MMFDFSSTAKKKIGTLACVLFSIFLFQNCGEEGFVSSHGIEVFDSFEEAYPEMNEEGTIAAKFESSRDFYAVSREVEREYNVVYRALPSRPAPVPPRNIGRTGGDTSGNFSSGDVNQESPTYVGQDRSYFEKEFNFGATIAQAGAIGRAQRKIFPARYYGLPKYQQAFGGMGLGIIGIDEPIGMSGAKTPATFYQYKLDYYRSRAVVFVVSDGLGKGKLGPSTVSVVRNDLVKLAKMGYLVIHLKPRAMKTAMLSGDENKCMNLGKFFFSGVQEVRRAVADVVSKSNYYGIDKNKMFMVGFGEGGTLAAETAFLDQSEAKSRYGVDLVEVPGFEGKSLFKGVAVSGGGVIDKSIVQGPSKARLLSIHGGNDRKVSVLGEQIYGCDADPGYKINPAASHYLTKELSFGASASVLHCGKDKPAEVRPLQTQIGYFATYFHNIMLSGGSGVAEHYRRCSAETQETASVCTYPIPLISQLTSKYVGQPVGNFYTKGPCTPKSNNTNDIISTTNNN